MLVNRNDSVLAEIFNSVCV